MTTIKPSKPESIDRSKDIYENIDECDTQPIESAFPCGDKTEEIVMTIPPADAAPLADPPSLSTRAEDEMGLEGIRSVASHGGQGNTPLGETS